MTEKSTEARALKTRGLPCCFCDYMCLQKALKAEQKSKILWMTVYKENKFNGDSLGLTNRPKYCKFILREQVL